MVLGAMVLTATTAAAQSLDQKIRAAATAAVTWVGYRVPMVAGPRQMCCYDNDHRRQRDVRRQLPARKRQRRVDEHRRLDLAARRRA